MAETCSAEKSRVQAPSTQAVALSELKGKKDRWKRQKGNVTKEPSPSWSHRAFQQNVKTETSVEPLGQKQSELKQKKGGENQEKRGSQDTSDTFSRLLEAKKRKQK